MNGLFATRVGIAAVSLAVGAACAHTGATENRSAWQPGQYEVRNTTSCYARISSLQPSAGGLSKRGQFLAEVAPGMRTVVTIGTDSQVSYTTHKEPGAEPGEPGADCRGSGEVKVSRVASAS
jgi:hypothetical protein